MNKELIKKLLLGYVPFDLKQKYFANTTTSDEILKMQNMPEVYHKDWPRYIAETMVGYTCLQNIEQLIDDVVANNIPGDFIETGAWAGGACIYAKMCFDAHNEKRKVFVADSFEGLPKPEMDRYPQDAGDNHWIHEKLKVSYEEVFNNFKNYKCLDENVVFLKGWFKDTLPTIDNNQSFSIIRLDGDMYSSTMDALNELYPKLVKNGYCIIDDYALKNCAAAVNDYRIKHNITSQMIRIPNTGAGALYWKK